MRGVGLPRASREDGWKAVLGLSWMDSVSLPAYTLEHFKADS